MYLMPYDVYESKGYGKDGYIHDQQTNNNLSQSDQDSRLINSGAQSLTETEQTVKALRRKNEMINYRSLRVEYNRYVSQKGIRNHLYNPLIPFSLGMAIFSLTYATTSRDPQTHARMLSWRVHFQCLAIISVLGGAYVQIRSERNWIMRTAQERNIPVNKHDLTLVPEKIYRKYFPKKN